MNRQLHRWHSASLGRDMELLLLGHGGARVLVFPPSMGRFSDWEERGLVGAISDPIERGLVQLFCVDSVDAESWYAEDKSAAQRLARHQQYDRYLIDEVVPFTLEQNGTAFLISMGASFGGYHAVNFAFRHPSAVQRVLSMSGLMDIGRFLNGHYDENCYFNNPIHFLANEHDPKRLRALSEMDIILAVGREDGLRESNELLSQVLWSKGIWHALRLWDGFAHDWPVWAHMLQLYLAGHDQLPLAAWHSFLPGRQRQERCAKEERPVNSMGEDNFGNDGACEYLEMLVAKLVATITEIYRDDERLNLDEDGESMFMPSVELVALLCERYALAPPRPNVVKRWHDRYLKVYAAGVDSYNPDPEFQTARRRTIDNTFRWLQSLAESHWDT